MIHEKHKVLFIFGPTGCGKHMLINNFLTKHKIAY
jgi:predicted ATPase